MEFKGVLNPVCLAVPEKSFTGSDVRFHEISVLENLKNLKFTLSHKKELVH